MKRLVAGLATALCLVWLAPDAAMAQQQGQIKILSACSTATYSIGKLNYATGLPTGETCTSGSGGGGGGASYTAAASPFAVSAGANKPAGISTANSAQWIVPVKPGTTTEVDLTAPSGVLGADGATITSTSNPFPTSHASGSVASGAFASGSIASGAVASGAIASGAYASGSIGSGAIASGAVASGAYASGSISDGADVTLGTKADAATCATANTALACFRQLHTDITSAVPAGTNAIGAIIPNPVTSTNGSTTVVTGNTFQTLLALNSARKGCLIQNPSDATETLYVSVGIATGSATKAKSFQLPAGSSFSCNSGGNVITDNIAVTATTSAHAFVEVDQ